MEAKKKIIILAEEHPTNLTTLAFLGSYLAGKEIKECSKNLDKIFTESYMCRIMGKRSIMSRVIGRITSIICKIMNRIMGGINSKIENEVRALTEIYTNRIIDAVKTLENSFEALLIGQDIKLEEYEILDFLLKKSPTNNTKLYIEGIKDVLEERREINSLIKEYGIERNVVFLDEGNHRYEELKDENGNLLKNSLEVQIGREDYWVNKINTTIGDYKYAIAIVGRNHVRHSNEFIYRTSCNVSEEVGYFGEKLKRLGYEIEIIDVI
jgi:hypothetical protein